MKGKVALVTGSARGIGLEIAATLARAGAVVVLNARNREPLEQAQKQLADNGLAVGFEAFDVGVETEVEGAFQQILRRYGRLDILVNNAGVLLDKTVFETGLDEWENVLRSNLTGAFLCSRAAMRQFRRVRSGGRIIMIGSVAGQRGAPAGVVAYSASKAGLVGLAQTLAFSGAELEVTVNVVSPGMIETQMLQQGFGDGLEEAASRVPLGLGRPADVAEAVLFLAGESGRYITGATIDVNGGLYNR